MTPDYAALAGRLRDRAIVLRSDATDAERIVARAAAMSGQEDATCGALRHGANQRRRDAANMVAAASALDRLAAVEGALYSLVEEVEESGRWMMTRDEVLVEERHSYDIEVEATKVALATARRAMEGK